MSLRSLLTYAHEDAGVATLARAVAPGAGERAFVSSSMRPYLLAALLDAEPERPALVVAGDDRSARDLAADLKAFLAPRLVRFYPARGVQYESHLAPAPHLVGLRVAALDALLDPPREVGAAVVVASAAALCEKVPDPALRPHGFALQKGELEIVAVLTQLGWERQLFSHMLGARNVGASQADILEAIEIGAAGDSEKLERGRGLLGRMK